MSANPTRHGIRFIWIIMIEIITIVTIIIIHTLFYNNLSRLNKPLVIEEDSVKLIEVNIDGKTYYLNVENFAE